MRPARQSLCLGYSWCATLQIHAHLLARTAWVRLARQLAVGVQSGEGAGKWRNLRTGWDGEISAAHMVRHLAQARTCHPDLSAGLRSFRGVRRAPGHEDRLRTVGPRGTR